MVPRFLTSRYKLDRLVYYEEFVTIVAAIAREKQIKGLTRLKEIQLIVDMNPTWKDLSEGWYDRNAQVLRCAQDDVLIT